MKWVVIAEVESAGLGDRLNVGAEEKEERQLTTRFLTGARG